ncbi:MAG: glycosyltransferase [Armatimonadetes bacterium CG_4_10_14_3_um_filter_66_18]|nr:glycosyltransferase family 2 protein [Armatimonadota bacterium]OIP07266.1 MAG: glycosyltransferase [Armatimonadetes bacterium CG2_30_66_41]PIU91296.1 MAG: glycosyltransferase [Armatimonadetes bacterium CG06_land_8_20_14_3_00_66_21]PIY48872.1 MAG: glycosyltransferase [Armatimonadetes bacterium CG_4_10_14_3_um_filter_66_18]PIZ32474.1 MAG: glycosyltransferase [Armatimonadetes bacterium CG_4_10_14_0_8_um_filter_66_14]PJB71748.1 MAG: glycosyltransferase [Armatimonadetes bacterium CG_4_9_14_3_um_
MPTEHPLVSLVIPVRNEAGNVAVLLGEIAEAMGPLDVPWEVVFVDDGSTDDTFAELRSLHDSHTGDGLAVRVVRFRRNFGKSAALAAGFEAARGAVVITMDGDLQDDPAELPRLLAQLDQGYDLVSGWKKVRRDPLSKTLPSRLFNRILAWVSGLPLHDFNCGLKAYRREVVQEIRLHGELHRFVPILAHAKGFRVGELVVNHRPRAHGRSKYGWGRLVQGFLDLHTVLLLTRYASKPLHLFGGTGLCCLLMGLAANAYLATLWFLGIRPIGNRPLLLLGVLLMILGVQLVSLGLVGEMLISQQPDEQKSYSVAERLE